jgi:hypothetical protein
VDLISPCCNNPRNKSLDSEISQAYSLTADLSLRFMLQQEKLLSNIGQLEKNYREGPYRCATATGELTKTYEKSMDLGW